MPPYLRFGNAVSIEEPPVAGGEVAPLPAASRWSVTAQADSSGALTAGTASGAGASGTWVVVSPAGSTGRVTYGSTIALYSIPTRAYLSCSAAAGSTPGYRDAALERSLGTYQQCEILKHGAPESRDEVRVGDPIALRFTGEFCLSRGAAPARADGKGPVGLAHQMAEPERWTLVAVPPAARDVDDFAAVMNSPNNSVSVLLSQGISIQQIAAKIAGQIPEVGGVVAGLIGILFPERAPDIWGMIKAQVRSLAKDMIFEANLDEFQTNLDGTKTFFHEYLTSGLFSEKSVKLGYVLGVMENFKQHFYKPERPERTLPYLLATGTLHIAALHEQYVHCEDLYLPGPHDTQTPAQRKRDLLVMLQKEGIEFYTAAVQKAKANILTARGTYFLSLKESQSRSQVGQGGSATWVTNYTWTFEDAYTGFRKVWEAADGRAPGKHQEANTWVSNYKSMVLNRLDGQIEALIEPMYAWRYMNPEVNELPIATTRSITFGPFGLFGGNSFYDNPAGEPITGIAMRAGEYVDGIEVAYGPRTTGVQWHGGGGGGLMSERLQPGEKIISVSGRTGEYVDALHFQTNTREIVGGGGSGGNPFSVMLPQATDPVLVRLIGSSGSLLDSIAFEWQYTRFE